MKVVKKMKIAYLIFAISIGIGFVMPQNAISRTRFRTINKSHKKSTNKTTKKKQEEKKKEQSNNKGKKEEKKGQEVKTEVIKNVPLIPLAPLKKTPKKVSRKIKKIVKTYKPKGRVGFKFELESGYDNNTIDLSPDEQRIFNNGPKDANYYINGTKRFIIDSIGDVYSRIGTGLFLETDTLVGKKTVLNLDYMAYLYVKDWNLNHHDFSLSIDQNLLDNVSMHFGALYGTKRHYRMVRYPDPVINNGLTGGGFIDASYSESKEFVEVDYDINKTIGIFAGYSQKIWDFSGAADYLDIYLSRPGFGFYLHPNKNMLIRLDYRFQYAAGGSIGTETGVVTSDPSYLGHYLIGLFQIKNRLSKNGSQVDLSLYASGDYREYLSTNPADISYYNRYEVLIEGGLSLGYTFLRKYRVGINYEFQYNRENTMPEGVLFNDRSVFARSFFGVVFDYTWQNRE